MHTKYKAGHFLKVSIPRPSIELVSFLHPTDELQQVERPITPSQRREENVWLKHLILEAQEMSQDRGRFAQIASS
jgi:hypothetical protein